MTGSTLRELYAAHAGKVSDKWSSYLSEYDRLFEPFRTRPVCLLEIGVQNGGSLEIWSQYFGNASDLIGCDIDPQCAQLVYTDPRIEVIVGGVNAPVTGAQLLRRCPRFDIIIDDGSHFPADVIKSFALYFPRLSDGGIFVVEDLHCSYWKLFDGGLLAPSSTISFFKRLADVINHEHWGLPRLRADILRGRLAKYGCEFDAESLAHVHSVEFVNSMCVVRKAPQAENQLGHRVVAGALESVAPGLLPMNGIPYRLAVANQQAPEPCMAGEAAGSGPDGS